MRCDQEQGAPMNSSLSTHPNLQGGISMLVQLDEKTWEVSDTDQLEKVLADLSDRAQAQGRMVTQLVIDDQPMTEQELVPPTLAKVVSTFGKISAKSERMDNILKNSQETAKKFGHQIRVDAQQLVEDFRRGKSGMRQLDQWFGQIADYLEWIQIQKSVSGESMTEPQDLSHWVNELMNARKSFDEVRVADMLEYEVIPRLP